MDFLIVYKWLHVYQSPYSDSTREPPSIITLLINMVLSPFQPPDPPLFEDAQFEMNLGLILLVAAIIMVPIMLLPKPFLVRNQNRRKVVVEDYHVKQPLLHPNEEHALK
jgi:V-type H+-transporting ATPase subunit a